MLPFTFAPWVDGDYLPEHPAQLLLEGRHAQVDIIAGVTRDEGALFASGKYSLSMKNTIMLQFYRNINF